MQSEHPKESVQCVLIMTGPVVHGAVAADRQG